MHCSTARSGGTPFCTLPAAERLHCAQLLRAERADLVHLNGNGTGGDAITFWVQQTGDAVLLLDGVECGVETLSRTRRSCLSPVKQIGTVAMDERRERQPVAPRCREIVDPYTRVASCGSPGPAKQCLARSYIIVLADNDVGNLFGFVGGFQS